MSKRFFDTEIWDKDWFMALPEKHKLFFQFLFSKCDVAGVWTPNFALASTYIGKKVSKEDLKLFERQIFRMPDGKIFLLDFIFFQYGKLTETCPPHRKIISLLKNYGLFERVTLGYQKGSESLQDIEEEKEKDKEEEVEKEKEKDGEPKKIIYPFDTESFYAMWGEWKEYKKDEFKFEYKSLQSEQAALTELGNISGGIEEAAIKVILQSMGNGWKGFFDLKKNNNGNGNYKNADRLSAIKQRLSGTIGEVANFF